jgi:predicted NBD/HSP70 family sugar kinase
MSIDENDALVYLIDLVRTQSANTRADLIKISGLGRSIVSQRIDEAIRLGLLEDSELGISTGGRIPRNLRFCDEIGTFVIFEFGARNVGIAVTNLSGTMLQSCHENWDISLGPVKSLNHVLKIANGMLAELNLPHPWATIVGIPGPVEYETGKPVAPPIMPGWNGFDIRSFMTEALGAPCWVDNDVNLMALGEQFNLQRYGLTKAYSENLLYIKVGSGIGSGIISHGNVHRGANGSAGDIGHVAIAEDSNISCRCGQFGCLEAIAGGWALARDAAEATKSGKSEFLQQRLEQKGSLGPADLADGAGAGDSYCVDAVTQSGKLVGETLAGLVNFLNPSVVVVGGSIASSGDMFLAAVRQTVYRRSLPLATRDLRIILADSRNMEGLIGGASLAQSETFSRSYMNAWVADGNPRIRFNR